MKKNKKTLAAILITITLISVLFLLYYFFLKPKGSNTLTGEGLIPVDTFAVNKLGVEDYGSLSSEAGRELLTLLADVKSISFDTDFVTSTGFTSLEDRTPVLEPLTAGRDNPFAPIQ